MGFLQDSVRNLEESNGEDRLCTWVEQPMHCTHIKRLGIPIGLLFHVPF